MKRWQADRVPQYGLSLKYLKMILKPAELKDLIAKYMSAKEVELSKKKSKKQK